MRAFLCSVVVLCFVVGGVPSPAATPPTAAADKSSSAPVKKEEPPRFFAPMVWGPDNEWKLQFGGMQRVRIESRRNFDMDKEIGDNDNLALIRSQVNLDLVYREVVRVYAELLDSRVSGARTDIMATAYAHPHQLFLELRDPKRTPWSIRLGRQEMSLGEARLFESSPAWSNTPVTYDGVRIMRNTPRFDMNLFVLQPDIYTRHHKPANTTDEKHPENHLWLYGVYSTFRTLNPHEFDLYLVGLSDRDDERTFPSAVKSESGKFGTTDRYTAGTRWRGPIRKWEGIGTLGYDAEAGYQFGQRAGDEIRGYFAHGDLNYQWERPWKPKLTLVANVASGDRVPADGVAGTFSPLFGTSHTPYGIIDFVRLQNLREIGLDYSVQPTEKLTVETGIHQFWLDSRTDSWYFGNGSSYARDKGGQSGRDLGQEIDIVAKYKMNKFLTLEGGAAHFFEGNYAEKNGRRDGASYLYMQYVLRF